MEAVAATFVDVGEACKAVEELRARGLDQGRTTVLFPGTGPLETRVEADDTEAPGMGGVVGGVVGGAVGLATASMLVAGVGPILVAGAVAGGLAGAVGGGVAGRQLERKLSLGLTHDELEVYADALRSGRTVVIAGGDTGGEADAVRDVLRDAGAESIDAARKDWLLGLRDDG